MDAESEVPLCSIEEQLKPGIICNLKHHNEETGAALDDEAEFDDPKTVLAIRGALLKHGAEAVIIEADEHLEKAIKDSGINFAFNIAEGKNGRSREAQVPAMLELLGIPYTGSDPTAMGISLDKTMCKMLVSAYGVRTAPHVLVRPQDHGKLLSIDFPVIVKPNCEGSGKGISENCIAENEAELEQLLERNFTIYSSEMLVESYLPGREFTVGMLGNGRELRVLDPMEIVFNGNTQRNYKVYSYDVKCNYQKHVTYECPAKLTAEESAEMKAAAEMVFEALGCRDVARADFRMDAEGHPCFLEINPLPGLAPGYSDLPMIAEADGISYDDLVWTIYETACRRLFGMQK
ncbi:MAG: ATP-grasp domain-containing protein [Solobacterium sp.]|jgi:D-alanine-D-alanine ligase|nr:ATP-grasp domain-containing protein [Solobacterium sp.]MCH4222896.1 ATP-grasp domain-containing protein [Solobacterium sp.]MCH4266602.1 ATP-grasp domain-containing protein [Solobacterium sp.]